MLIGGISTVFFNGNPLLKFDGYYVLADWIEIPNLAARSRRYLSQVVQTSLFGAKDGDRPAASTGEAAWFVCYGLGSVGYRVVILLLIALYLSGTFFIAGILLAAWVLVSQFAIPMAKSVSALRRLSRNPRTTLRAYGVSVAMLSVVSILLFAIPFPSVTNAEGVLWLAERSVVRAGTDCFIVATLQASGSQVSPGTPLIECSDPELLAEEKVLSAKIAALQREYRGFALREQVRRKMLADEMAALTAELDLTRDRIDALLIRSEVAGTFVIPDDIRLPGRFLKHGDIAGFVMSAEAMAVRTAVPQDRIGLIREDVESVAMRLASTPGRAYPTSVLRHMPAAATHLPSASLGALGGGALAVDTSDDAGTLLEEEAFLVDLALPEEMAPTRIGERVHVRFRHGSEGLARQWFRGIKLLLMRQINV
jgi:putative peptide zinc metalloprotease protein